MIYPADCFIHLLNIWNLVGTSITITDITDISAVLTSFVLFFVISVAFLFVLFFVVVLFLFLVGEGVGEWNSTTN